jgi:hypothetical protein
MKKIDELVLKILELSPTYLHENGSNLYYLFYKDITLCFWNMDKSVLCNDLGLVKINSGDAYNISATTKKLALKYFNKSCKIDDLLNKLNKDIRKEKLLSINQ